MIIISNKVSIDESEVEITAIRSQGAGGQNVNKVSSAIHLRFDIKTSSLSSFYKERLLKLKDSRISADGIVIIKAQKFRTQIKNKEDAINRLVEIIKKSGEVQKTRRPTKASYSAKKKRMDSKNKRGKIKSMRGKVDY